jgi:hypothetical protein
MRLKQRQSPATFPKKAGRLRNLAEGLSVSQSPAAPQRAKPGMPTFYTENDFSLVRLHQPSAGTISISVTSRERVGRTNSLPGVARPSADVASRRPRQPSIPAHCASAKWHAVTRGITRLPSSKPTSRCVRIDASRGRDTNAPQSLVRSQIQKGRNEKVSALFTSAHTPSQVAWRT